MSFITIHTLGPVGTNCERAAYEWIKINELKHAKVMLHETLESAIPFIKGNHLLLGCAVYPKLHEIVFKNLDKFKLLDSFIMPTYNMVLAGNDTSQFKAGKIASHPAPYELAKKFTEDILLANSNAEAALLCKEDKVKYCITTLKAVKNNDLTVIEDFGEVPMCFTIHGQNFNWN